MAWRLEDRIQCQQKMDGYGRSNGAYRTNCLFFSYMSEFDFFFNQLSSLLRYAFLIPAPVSVSFLATFAYKRQTRGLQYLGAGLIY